MVPRWVRRWCEENMYTHTCHANFWYEDNACWPMQSMLTLGTLLLMPCLPLLKKFPMYKILECIMMLLKSQKCLIARICWAILLPKETKWCVSAMEKMLVVIFGGGRIKEVTCNFCKLLAIGGNSDTKSKGKKERKMAFYIFYRQFWSSTSNESHQVLLSTSSV